MVLWTLLSPDHSDECTGALIDMTPALGVLAFVNLCKFSESDVVSQEIDGRPVISFQAEPATIPPRLEQFDRLEDAMAWLDGEKQSILQRGWIEIAFKAVNDPD